MAEGQAGAQGDWRDAIDQAARRIGTALVIAAGMVAVSIYARPAPPRFEAVAADGRLYRVDTKSGTVLACEGNRCITVVKRGQHLERSFSIETNRERERDAPAIEAPAAPAAPAAPRQP